MRTICAVVCIIIAVASEAQAVLRGEKIARTVYVPVRSLGASLGASVTFDPRTSEITLSLGGRIVVLVDDSAVGWSNNDALYLWRTPPPNQGGVIHVPVRTVAEALGAQVDWDARRRQVTITTPGAAVMVDVQIKAPPCAGRLGINPIIDARDGYLLGGIAHGGWLGHAGMRALLHGGVQYRLYSLTSYLGTARGVLHEYGDLVEGSVRLTPAIPIREEAIGVGGRWNAMPRIPRLLDLRSHPYHALCRGILDTHGLARAEVRIRQLISVDLEGDGRREALISASALSRDAIGVRGEVNDYSFVAVQTAGRREPQTHLLAADFFRRASGHASEYRVAAVLDLDGDGVLEIVVHNRWYDGEGYTAYRVHNRQVTLLFHGGYSVGGWAD